MELLNFIGLIVNLYLGYVWAPFPILETFSALPAVMISQRKNDLVLPKSQVSLSTFQANTELNSPANFWQRIILMITDSWFFDWLKEEKKTVSPDEKILLEKRLSKSKYSRVI